MIQSIEEVIERIETIPELKDKIVYDHFTTPQELPFSCYTYDFDTDGADDYKGVQWIDFRLELYSDPRDITLEGKILEVLSDVEISTDSGYIESERMYKTVFDFTFPHKLTNPE